MQKQETKLTVTNDTILSLIQEIESLEVVDKTSLDTASENLSQVNKYLDAVIAYKEKKTVPLNALLKAIRSETKPIENALEELKDNLTSKMSVYQTHVTAKLKQEQEAIASRIGEGKGKLKVETAVRKIEELSVVDKHVETTSGKITFRTDKKFEVVDFSLLPDNYKLPDERLIRDAMKAGIEIAGVRYFEEQVPINYR